MTAQEADRGSIVDALARAAGAHPRTVRDFLRGYPPGRDRAAERLRSAAEAAGVDLATIPALPPEELAEHAAKRRGKCSGCTKLESRAAELGMLLEQSRGETDRAVARIAELEAQLAAAESRAYPMGSVAAVHAEDARARAAVSDHVVTAEPAPEPEQATARPPLAIVRTPQPKPRVVTIVMPGETLPAAG